MNGPPDEFAKSKEQSDRIGMDFLRTELAACFAFASVAETERSTGHLKPAARSVADAEEGYARILSFLLDPKQESSISDEERRELREGMARLRGKLDELKA